MSNQKEKSLSNAELDSFCSQFAAILHAGISPTEGLTIMLEDSTSQEEKRLLQSLLDGVTLTGMLSPALEDTGVFPAYMLQMIRLGEQAGRLDEVLESLSTHYERQNRINSYIKSAVTYPCIMIGMMAAVVLILILEVLPVFNQVFRQLGQEMSSFSQGLMELGNALRQNFIFFIILLVVIIGLILYFALTASGKRHAAAFFDSFGPFRSFAHKRAACRFAEGLCLSLKSGLPAEAGISMADQLTGSPAFHERAEKCQALLDEGTPLTDALSQTGIFTGLQARMLVIGDKTGSMEQALEKIAAQYEEEMDETVTNLLSVLEPTLVAALSVIVGLILLSVMLPLMGILSGM